MLWLLHVRFSTCMGFGASVVFPNLRVEQLAHTVILWPNGAGMLDTNKSSIRFNAAFNYNNPRANKCNSTCSEPWKQEQDVKGTSSICLALLGRLIELFRQSELESREPRVLVRSCRVFLDPTWIIASEWRSATELRPACNIETNPDCPSTQYLRFLVLKTIHLMVFHTVSIHMNMPL